MSTVALENPTGDALVFGTPAGLVPAVAEADPVTGAPADRATETTLAALKGVADSLLTAATAIQSAAEALDGKTTAVNTGAIAGTVALDAPSLAALETVSASTDFWASVLRALENLSDGPQIDAASGRLRVVLDTNGGAQALGTLTTMSQIGGIPANSTVYDLMDAAWAQCIRPRIA